MAAYVVTRNALGPHRDIRAANICQVLMGLIPEKRWGEQALGEARDVSMQTLVSTNTKNVGASLWAVTWHQPIALFERPSGPLGASLYVGHAPAIGSDHEGDYQQIGGTET